MDRRSFFLHVGGAAAALSTSRFLKLIGSSGSPGPRGFAGRFVEIARPVPRRGGKVAERFDLIDDLVLPEGYGYEILVRWGDRFGAVEFGANADHTAILPIAGRPGSYHLMVNHEYVSATPWLQGFRTAKGRELPLLQLTKKGLRLGETTIAGNSFDLEALADELAGETCADRAEKNRLLEDARVLCREALDDLGISLLELESGPDGGLRVAAKGKHRRITALRTIGVADDDAPRFSGPGRTRLGAPPGTMSNCSGGTSPWGSFFTCEENFQDYTTDEIAADGTPTRTRRNFGAGGGSKKLDLPEVLRGIGQGAPGGPLDGRQFGWVGEIDPNSGRLTKHISLGRFRHENVAIAAAAGKKLAAYMGDDRRGGHVWKYVSRAVVIEPTDRRNSRLLETGSLMVASFAPDGSGRWLQLEPETPLSRPRPELGKGGALHLPRRSRAGDAGIGGAVRVGRGGISVDEWIADVEGFTGKEFARLVLGDLVRPVATSKENESELRCSIILMDAFLMANAIGGTPSARPEDLECNFAADGALDVFISFTDFAGDADGSPRLDVFPDSDGETSRRYGAIHHLVEHEGDPAAMTFRWSVFVASGEPSDGGGGFAAPDNIAFDPEGEMWIVTDMGLANAEVADRAGTPPGSKNFQGIFGNNAMWWLPRNGEPCCFAAGPMESELTGPSFFRLRDGEVALLLAVQHPGEQNGKRQEDKSETRHHAIRQDEKTVVVQERSVPRGSSFAAREDGVPRSAVCLIRRVAKDE